MIDDVTPYHSFWKTSSKLTPCYSLNDKKNYLFNIISSKCTNIIYNVTLFFSVFFARLEFFEFIYKQSNWICIFGIGRRRTNLSCSNQPYFPSFLIIFLNINDNNGCEKGINTIQLASFLRLQFVNFAANIIALLFAVERTPDQKFVNLGSEDQFNVKIGCE